MSRSAPDSVSATVEKPRSWSVQLLHEMDWHRFRELVRTALRHQGFRSSLISMQVDGGALYSLSNTAGEVKGLLQCPSWRNDEVDLNQAAGLHTMVSQFKAKKGILVTPGHVTYQAKAFGAQRALELVDGWMLLEWVAELPATLQAELLRMATAGQYQVPVCPGCGGRMVKETLPLPPEPPRMMGNLVLRESRFISWPVRCRELVVKPGVEVHFRKGVVAEDVEIMGTAYGEILCTGRFHLGGEAGMHGGVACRRLKLEPGGELDGEAVILRDGDWAPGAIGGEWFRQPPEVWRCASYQPCDVTLEAR